MMQITTNRSYWGSNGTGSERFSALPNSSILTLKCQENSGYFSWLSSLLRLFVDSTAQCNEDLTLIVCLQRHYTQL